MIKDGAVEEIHHLARAVTVYLARCAAVATWLVALVTDGDSLHVAIADTEEWRLDLKNLWRKLVGEVPSEVDFGFQRRSRLLPSQRF